MPSYPRLLPIGDTALTLELGDALDPALNARVRALDAALRRRPAAGFVESVPAYRSLLVVFDPGRGSFAEIREQLLRLLREPPGDAGAPGVLRRVGARYGGEHGPDLERVARAAGITADHAVRLHAGREYTAHMLGFMPGFAYLGPLAAELQAPRLATPRPRVPAGSVAIAGMQTGVYPNASPGGWNLIGRTGLRLFDPGSARPALIEPGDRVRFEPVDELAEPAPGAPACAVSEPAIEVASPGLLTSVQAAGRPGHRRLGVGRAGAADRGALLAANAALGNAADAAGLECTLVGPVLRFLRPTRFALAGADLGAVLERGDLGTWPVPPHRAVLGRPGSVLSFTGRRRGCRAYLAFAGGIDVPVVLGSRSTDLGAGFGGHAGRALRAGDLLALGLAAARDGRTAESRSAREPPASDATLRVVLGPQLESFGPRAVARFLGDTWAVDATSDRIACRLSGERLAHRGPAEIVTDGMVPGCVQVPPDGQPIVMLADCPTTGGYPKIATVIDADLDRLAQLLPGEGRVRFAEWHGVGSP